MPRSRFFGSQSECQGPKSFLLYSQRTTVSSKNLTHIKAKQYGWQTRKEMQQGVGMPQRSQCPQRLAVGEGLSTHLQPQREICPNRICCVEHNSKTLHNRITNEQHATCQHQLHRQLVSESTPRSEQMQKKADPGYEKLRVAVNVTQEIPEPKRQNSDVAAMSCARTREITQTNKIFH